MPTSGAPLVLVLAEPSDLGALRVASALQHRRDCDLALISTDQLLLAPRWKHDPFGDTEIELGNGTVLTNEAIGAVFCRIRRIDPPQFARADSQDRLYAQAEFYALILSWLEQLGGRVNNRPHAGSLVGTRASPLEDHLWFAGRDGNAESLSVASSARFLPQGDGVVVGYHPHDETALAGGPFIPVPETLLVGQPAMRLGDPTTHPRRHVTVVGDRVFGDVVSPRIEELTVRYARARNLTIAGFAFSGSEADELGFCSITPDPDLVGQAVQSVADLLVGTAIEAAR